MIVADIWQSPAFGPLIALIIAAPSAAVAFLGYRRSVRVDQVAAQAGIATRDSVSIGQVVEGLNLIIGRLRDDNNELRAEIERLKAQFDAIQLRLDALQHPA
jgi:hypothetical protein